MIICEFCGKETPAGTRGRPKRFCSYECRNPRKTIQPTHCVICKAALDFSNRGRTKNYCSRKCRDFRRAVVRKEARQINKTCLQCQTPFRSAKKDQRFCSTQCRQTRYKTEKPHKRNTQPKIIICGWCGVGLIVPPNFTGATKYHDECRVQARRARYRIKTVKRQSITVKPSRLSADQLVAQRGAVCGICHGPIDLTLKRTSKMGLTVDHIIPLSKGGQDTLENMQPAHWVCNVKKGNKVDA